MRHLSVSVVVLASAGMLSPAAHAADLPIGGPAPYAVEEFVSNWYLRGDVGYQFSGSSDSAGPPLTNSSYSDRPVVDFGVGYRQGWVRGDLTMSWFEPQFAGGTALSSSDVVAKFDVLTTLANVYVDLGSWYGITPYVGGGVGFSWLHPSDFSTLSVPIPSRGDSFDFSWDLTTGFSYAITRQFLIDTSYRYLRIGTPKSGIGTSGTLDYGSMDAHEFKTGFRYMID